MMCLLRNYLASMYLESAGPCGNVPRVEVLPREDVLPREGVRRKDVACEDVPLKELPREVVPLKVGLGDTPRRHYLARTHLA